MAGNKRGSSSSLGDRCLKKPKKDLTGMVFGNWEVVGLSHREGMGLWYWDVECTNCGFGAKRFTAYVKSSKGCICCGMSPRGESGLTKVVASYKESARERGLVFELTRDQVKRLTSEVCHYCGRPPEKIKRRIYVENRSDWGEYVYNGIDRMDNKIGYIVENCVPCCEVCNRAKNDMEMDVWESYLRQLKLNILQNKVPFFNSEC